MNILISAGCRKNGITALRGRAAEPPGSSTVRLKGNTFGGPPYLFYLQHVTATAFFALFKTVPR